MRGIVVYHSYWGSSRKIAEAVTRGLKDLGHVVETVSVKDAGNPDASLDFIVIGGATRWPGAPRKIKAYARKVAGAGFAGKPFAAFSTGGTMFDDEPNQQASEVLSMVLTAGGLIPLAPPFKAGIDGYRSFGRDRGTLPESEVTRAREFGRELGAELSLKFSD
jgi:flavodoxin